MSQRLSHRIGYVRPSSPDALIEVAADRETLERAVTRALGLWRERLAHAFTAEEIHEAARWAVHAVAAAASGDEVRTPEGSPVLCHFLLERSSAALLEDAAASATIGKEAIVRLMLALDAARRLVEPEWGRYFETELSGPDGLNLVVEVVHDLRSPLTSIRCLAEILERGQSGPVTPLQQRQLRLIYGAAMGLSSMATDVLEMARRGDQIADVEETPFSIDEILSDVFAMVRPIAEEKGLLMQTGSLASDRRRGPATLISRVLLNLITNALKFTDSGSVEARLRAVSRSRVEFSVVDTGPGIPDAAIPDLFRPFRRSEARAGRSGFLFSETGLGLALCRRLLRRVGSELQFETAPGQGTRFYFELDLPPAGGLPSA